MDDNFDMGATIAPKSDQLNADDLIAGPRTITVRKVTAQPDVQLQPVSVFFDGDNNKPYKPCLSMRRVMVRVWGRDSREYVGKSMTLYCDVDVVFGGMKVGGIRISHMTGIDSPVKMALTEKRGSKAIYEVKPLAVQQTQAPTAEQWADAQITKVATASADWLDKLMASAGVTKLKDSDPDQHARIDTAVEARRNELLIAAAEAVE